MSICQVYVLGATMAAAWVTLRHLGQDGYMKIAENLQKTVKVLIDGINSIDVSKKILAKDKGVTSLLAIAYLY